MKKAICCVAFTAFIVFSSFLSCVETESYDVKVVNKSVDTIYVYVQVLTQKFVHHYLKPVGAPDYVHYNFFKGGPYSYFGYNNPISLWNY